MSDEELCVYTIFQNASDVPDEFSCRRFCTALDGLIYADPILFARGDAIEPIREELQHMGLTRFEREETDDPCIVETWI